MALRIVALEKDYPIQSVELSSCNPIIRIGRDVSQCKIALPPQANGVSRIHAVIEWKKGSVTLCDQSTYGTLINGENVLKKECKINSGDVITVGIYKFKTEKVSVFDQLSSSQRSMPSVPPVTSQSTITLSRSKKRAATESTSSQNVKQVKISSFFGARSRNASAIEENIEVLAYETPSRSFLASKPSNSNISVVEDSARIQEMEKTRQRPLLLSERKLKQVYEDEKPLVEDTPEIKQRRHAFICGNRSIVGDSLASEVPTLPSDNITSQTLKTETKIESFDVDDNKHFSLPLHTPKTLLERPTITQNAVSSFDMNDGVTMQHLKKPLKIKLGKPKIGGTQRVIPFLSSASAKMNSEIDVVNSSSAATTTVSLHDRCSVKPTQTENMIFDARISGVKSYTIMDQEVKNENSVTSLSKSTLIAISEDVDHEPDLLNLSAVHSQMKVPSPLCNSTQISSSEAPTLRVNRLDRALEAVSPKKKKAHLSENTIPEKPCIKGRRELLRQTQSITKGIDYSRKKIVSASSCRLKKELKIEEVKKEFDDLYSQLCSGKKIEEEIEGSGDEKEKSRIRMERERHQIEEIQQNMDKITSFIEMRRPVTQMNYTVNTTLVSTPDGRPNFKKFRKAAQGRFNPNITSNFGCARIAGKDLVDFRKIQN